MSNSTKRFYLLSVDIFKTLSLKKEHRPIPAKNIWINNLIVIVN